MLTALPEVLLGDRTPSDKRGGSAPAVSPAAGESPPATLLLPSHWGNHTSLILETEVTQAWNSNVTQV